MHNILLAQSHEEVETLLQILRDKGMGAAVVDDEGAGVEGGEAMQDDVAAVQGSEKRTQLGLYLSLQRRGQR